MDRLIKRHRKCPLTSQDDFDCDCDYYVYYYDWARKKGAQRKSLRTANKRRAEQKMREFLRQLEDRAVAPLPLQQALDWAISAARTKGTADSLRDRGARLIEALGNCDLRTITTEDLQEFVDGERERVTKYGRRPTEETIGYYLLALQTMRRVAAKKHAVPGLPRIQDLKPELYLRPMHERAKTRILTRAEAKSIVDAYAHMPHEQAFVMLALYTGARRSTVWKIRPEHFIERDTAAGPETYVHLPGTKTKGSNRVIPCHPDLVEYIDRGIELPVRPYKKITEHLPKICKRLGIPKATPNDLRRTFCSWMILAGHLPPVVAKMMGHGSTRMVQDVYTQLFPDTEIAAIRSLPSILHFEDDHATTDDQPAPAGTGQEIHARRADRVRPNVVAGRPGHQHHGVKRHARPDKARIREGAAVRTTAGSARRGRA